MHQSNAGSVKMCERVLRAAGKNCMEHSECERRSTLESVSVENGIFCTILLDSGG